MYTIEKSRTFDDELKITDENRELLLKIHLEINPSMIPQYRALLLRLTELQKQSQPDVTSIGACIVDIDNGVLIVINQNFVIHGIY